MQRFAQSCDASLEYPENLLTSSFDVYKYARYRQLLDQWQRKLFDDEKRACAEIWERLEQPDDYRLTALRTIEDIKNHLNRNGSLSPQDPYCRMIFVQAQSSRDPLLITREMLTYLLTYHRVMPQFLDFAFSFGQQIYAQDFQYSGFRVERLLSHPGRNLDLNMLGRSGRGFQLCYSLRSAEPAQAPDPSPVAQWSIRQAAVYHCLDLETDRSFWIMLKANSTVKDRITAATSRASKLRLGELDSPRDSLTESMKIHQIMLEWTMENWRWYVNALEEELQRTRRTLSVRVQKPPNPLVTNPSSIYPATPVLSQKTPTLNSTSKKSLVSGLVRKINPGTRESTMQSFSSIQSPTGPRSQSSSLPEWLTQEDFSFQDLQRIQSTEDKVSETLLILQANECVVSELQHFYESLLKDSDESEFIGNRCAAAIQQLSQVANDAANELRMQQTRVNTLLRLFSARKSHMYGMLDYRNMEASKLLAMKAQISTEKMEGMTEDMHKMTKDMHIIAGKTERETVSMRIVTLVTLLFLPATFTTTLMSTDILQLTSSGSDSPREAFSLVAFERFLAITLPLTAGTFALWYAVYRWVTWKETIKRKMREASMHPHEKDSFSPC
ncbi:MAG: hypothetical protein M1820_003047 [Bogoriella megaspora]|nr:MAG: hypothetical protein M1820_003047 [Bogoriella megaspora]